MTKSEYSQLADFLAKKFARMDARFETIDTRFDRIDARFDRIDARFDEQARHTGVLIEDLRHRIEAVAEGVTTNGQRIDRALEAIKENGARIDRIEDRIEGIEGLLKVG